MSTTGQRIKNRRKELELSADDIAVELDVSRSTIFRYENGSIEKVPANVLETLAHVLRTTPAYLMGWEDDPEDYDNLDIDIPTWWEGSTKEYLNFLESKDKDHQKEVDTQSKLLTSFTPLIDKNKEKVISYTENLLKIQMLDSEQKHSLLRATYESTSNKIVPIIQKEEPDHLKVRAAHNDNAADPEQQRLMRQDLQDMEDNW